MQSLSTEGKQELRTVTPTRVRKTDDSKTDKYVSRGKISQWTR